MCENYVITDDMLEIVSITQDGKLPDPFVFENGKRVETPDDWRERRKEIYKNAVELQYGVMPPENQLLEVESLYLAPKTKIFRITAGAKEHPVSFRMKLLLPENADNPPVIVDGDGCFNYSMDKQWLGAALNNGIAWALFDRTELAHDVQNEGRCKGQLFEAYENLDCGAIAAWAWGYLRVTDALVKLGLTDNDCIVFSGHSRGGKTCALAGALDERAAIVNPNSTCAGSMSCYRSHMTAKYEGGNEILRSEELKDLWQNYPFWMGKNLGDYRENVDSLPFDCHELKALIAPRTLLLTEAAGDVWSNPVGCWQTTLAAKEVYSFLGKEDEILLHYRPGKHFHDVDDVRTLVNVIKHKTNAGKNFDRSEFFRLPFKTDGIPPAFDWKKPEKQN